MGLELPPKLISWAHSDRIQVSQLCLTHQTCRYNDAKVATLAASRVPCLVQQPSSNKRVSLATLSLGIKTLSYAERGEMRQALDAAARISQKAQRKVSHTLLYPVPLATVAERSTLSTLSAAVRQLPYPEATEMNIASTAASATSFERVMRPVGQPESFWMEHLNSRLLSAAFETSFESGEILSVANSVWTKGRELQDARLAAVPGFTDPKPDTAFGIGFENRSVAGKPFCASTLARLQEAFPYFVLSPDGRETLRALMPGFIYEAKPDLERPDVVKAQIALGAARVLAVLQRLKQLSRTVSPPPVVVCATSTAHHWDLYLATVSTLQCPHQWMSSLAHAV
ncbi:hypothetical protein BCV69DRAFT_276809 [Microstroma glucosiphilum]|uniref:Uncharacterized protein n=1 Tax=Pseudomicrostroma glucosiphilum TaxID=1684307 RepID=A0A316UA07_9BASI|nr:hypothetical protein BCV69DRAFT_276809 [Pseudomicrostroma glucosiphilum]PWN21311.1 hypothetical protein BCV69DRAFT_276809 [Pseudomicrostroma glucosiphilum]